ncbi:MAG: hypothetical protein ACYDBB_03480 [Armatimonadota bacterium]
MRFPHVLTILVLVLGIFGAVQAAEKTFTITDITGHGWAPQLVTYHVRFDPPVRDGALVLRDAAGTECPFQLSQAVKPAGRLSAADISFIAAMPPNGTVSYTLADSATRPAKPANALGKVTRQYLEVDNGTVGIRLAAPGEKAFRSPVPVANVPAPIVGYRLADGAWAGDSRFMTKRNIIKYSGQLTANGPVYTEAVYRYTFAPQGYYQLTVRVVAGVPLALMDEQYDMGEFTDGTDILAINLSKGWQPELLGWKANRPYKQCPEIDQQAAKIKARGWNPGGGYFELPVNAVIDSKLGDYVHPWAAWGGNGPLPPNSVQLTIQPWEDWGPAANYLYLARQADDGKRLANEVGFLTLHTGSWRRPYSSMAHLRTGADGVELALPIGCFGSARPFNPFDSAEEDPGVPLTYGRRVWAMTLAPIENAGQMKNWWLQYGMIGLDRYKDWVLEWEDPKGVETSYPRTYVNAAEVKLRQESLDTNPRKAALQQLYLFDPTDAKGKVSANKAIGLIGQRVNECSQAIVSTFRQAQVDNGVIPYCDDALAWPNLPPEQRTALRARIAGMCYVLSDPDFNPRGLGAHLGNPNMPINRYMGFPQYAALIPTHPRYQTWMKDAVAYMDWKLADNTSPNGAWREEQAYQQASVPHAMEALLALSHAGLATPDMLEHARAIHRQMLAVLSPPELNEKGLRYCEGTGNGTRSRGDSMPHAADLLRASDPEMAANLMWAWEAAGKSPGAHHIMNSTCWLPYDPSITPAAPKDIPGTFLPGMGATARAHFNTPGEAFLLFRQGHNQSHYDMDQGTFKLYAYGEQMMPNSALGYNLAPAGTTQHALISFGTPEWWNNHGRADSMVVDYAYLTTVDHLLGRQHFDLKSRRYNQDKAVGVKAPFDWYRQFLMMKSRQAENPSYLVLRDTFRGMDLQPSHWNTWVIAKSKENVETRQNVVTVTTPQDNRLDMVFLEPTAINPKVLWTGVTGGAGCGFPPTGAANVSIDQQAGKGYLAVIYPRRANMPTPQTESPAPGVLKVTTPEGTDWVFLSPDEPITFDNGEVSFTGRTGSVRIFNDEVHLVLAAGEGKVGYKGTVVKGFGPIEQIIPVAKLTQPATFDQPAPTSTAIAVKVDGERKTIQPGVSKVTLADGFAYLFDSPTVLDFAADGVVFHGRKGAVVVQGEKVRYVQQADPALSYQARIGYRDQFIRGEGPFDLTFLPAKVNAGGEVVGTADGRARLLEMTLPKNLVPANCPQKALPVDQISAQDAGIILTGVAPTLYLNGKQWQVGYYDRGMAVPLFPGKNDIRITRFYVPPIPPLPERAEK